MDNLLEYYLQMIGEDDEGMSDEEIQDLLIQAESDMTVEAARAIAREMKKGADEVARSDVIAEAAAATASVPVPTERRRNKQTQTQKHTPVGDPETMNTAAPLLTAAELEEYRAMAEKARVHQADLDDKAKRAEEIEREVKLAREAKKLAREREEAERKKEAARVKAEEAARVRAEAEAARAQARAKAHAQARAALAEKIKREQQEDVNMMANASVDDCIKMLVHESKSASNSKENALTWLRKMAVVFKLNPPPAGTSDLDRWVRKARVCVHPDKNRDKNPQTIHDLSTIVGWLCDLVCTM